MEGRPKKKPEYDPELQFNNFLQELWDAYEEADSLPECFKPKKKTMKFEENFVEPKNSFK